MKPILVTAATKRELSLLIDAVGGGKKSLTCCGEYYEGSLTSSGVILAVTGIGKVNTAMGITSLLGRYRPGIVINTGCGGAYPGSGLAVGDIVAATSELYGDEGVGTRNGWMSMETIGIPFCTKDGVRYFNEITLSASAVNRAMDVAAENGIALEKGAFITVSTCSGTLARGEELAARFGAICENMEGAAAAHVALCHGLDCLEIRGISNIVEDRDLARWDIDRAVRNVTDLLLKLIPSMECK